MRKYLKLLLVVLLLILPLKVYSEDYKSVDDILGDTFKPISTEQYDDAVKSAENVVVLFYDEFGMNSPTEWLALVYKDVAPRYEGKVKFYKFEHNTDPSLAYDNYTGMIKTYDIFSIPSTQLFKNGKKMYTVKGGPRSRDRISKEAEVVEGNLKYLIALDQEE